MAREEEEEEEEDAGCKQRLTGESKLMRRRERGVVGVRGVLGVERPLDFEVGVATGVLGFCTDGRTIGVVHNMSERNDQYGREQERPFSLASPPPPPPPLLHCSQQIHSHLPHSQDNTPPLYTDRQMDGQTDRETDRQRDRQIDRQTDRQIDRQTDRQTDR